MSNKLAQRKDILRIINRMIREKKGIDTLNELKFRIQIRDKHLEKESK